MPINENAIEVASRVINDYADREERRLRRLGVQINPMPGTIFDTESQIKVKPKTKNSSLVEFCFSKNSDDKTSNMFRAVLVNKLPANVERQLDNGWWLAGGAVRDMFAGMKPVDYDLYKQDKQLKVTTKNELQFINTPLSIPDVIKNYDYICCMAAIGKDKDGSWFGVCHRSFMMNSLNRVLHINYEALEAGAFSPASSFMRAFKFVARGWSIGTYELDTLVKQLNKLILDQKSLNYTQSLERLLQQSSLGSRINQQISEVEAAPASPMPYEYTSTYRIYDTDGGTPIAGSSAPMTMEDTNLVPRQTNSVGYPG